MLIEMDKNLTPTVFGMHCAIIPKGFEPYEAGIRGASKILPYLPHLKSKHARFLAVATILLHHGGVAEIDDFKKEGSSIKIKISKPFSKDLSFEQRYLEGIASACYGLPIISSRVDKNWIIFDFVEVIE